MRAPLTQRQMVGRFCLLLILSAAILAATACGDTYTAPPAGPGCSLVADVGNGVKVTAHYASCPAPAGSTTWEFQGQTFRVTWDPKTR